MAGDRSGPTPALGGKESEDLSGRPAVNRLLRAFQGIMQLVCNRRIKELEYAGAQCHHHPVQFRIRVDGNHKRRRPRGADSRHVGFERFHRMRTLEEHDIRSPPLDILPQPALVFDLGVIEYHPERQVSESRRDLRPQSVTPYRQPNRYRVHL
jgi:hypothetical protein